MQLHFCTKADADYAMIETHCTQCLISTEIAHIQRTLIQLYRFKEIIILTICNCFISVWLHDDAFLPSPMASSLPSTQGVN